MFKISKLLRALLSVGILHMTEEDTSGSGGGSLPNPDLGGGGGPDLGSQGGLQPETRNPWDDVPRSWAQENHPHWEKTPAEVRQIIHAREQAVAKGFETYRPTVERWNKLAGLFSDYTAQNPQADVGGLYETLAQNHIALVRSSPEERRALFQQMAQHYGVDFAEAAAGQQGQQAASGLDPSQVQRMVDERLRQALEPIQQERYQQHMEKTSRTVDAFFSDPKNEFVAEVAPGMTEYINSGITDLNKAYRLACLDHPEVSVKYLAKLAQSGAGGQGELSEGAPAIRNLKSSGEGAPAGKPKSMDDTMNAVAAKYYPGFKPS